MMRDNHSLNWQSFYNIIDKNYETLNKSRQLGNYYTDTHVIDIFGRASGKTFDQIKSIWRYDSPSGPGWGVRNWTDINWYADLNPVLTVSEQGPYFTGEHVNLIATIFNNGDTASNSVSVRFYNGANLLSEQFVNVNAHSNAVVNYDFTTMQAGDHIVYVKVDESNVKIETNDANNEDSESLSFIPYVCGDADSSGIVDISDAVYLISYIFQGGPAPNPLIAGDADESGNVDISDAVYLIQYIFQGGPAPCDPPKGYSGFEAISTQEDFSNYMKEISDLV